MSALHATEVSDASADAEMQPKYPHINVEMVGEDGNAFFIIGRCLGKMREAGCTQEQRDEFQKEATAGDYNHLLATVMAYFNIDSPEADDELDNIDEDEEAEEELEEDEEADDSEV